MSASLAFDITIIRNTVVDALERSASTDYVSGIWDDALSGMPISTSVIALFLREDIDS